MNTLLTAGFLDASLSQDTIHQDAGADLLTLLVDVLGHGVMVLGGRGQIIHTNRSARTELNRHRVLTRVGEVVQAVTPADGKTLQNALAKAVAGKRSLINVSGSGLTLTLAVVPLKPDVDARDARVALFFARAEVCESGMFGFFARSFPVVGRFGNWVDEEDFLTADPTSPRLRRAGCLHQLPRLLPACHP